MNRLEFRDDVLETQVVGHIDSLNEDLSALDGLYRGLVEDMRHGAQNTAMLIANFNLRVPVCLSGLGMLNYELHGVRKRALCFLAVIPEQAQTKIIIGAEKEHQNAIDLHFMDETSPALVARLESWMCHGSDHWFIAPSAWVAIPEQRRQAICDRILDVSHALADPVPFSVLDGTRSTINRAFTALAPAHIRRGSRCRHLIGSSTIRTSRLSQPTCVTRGVTPARRLQRMTWRQRGNSFKSDFQTVFWSETG